MALLEVTKVKQLPKLTGGFIFNTPDFQSLKSGTHLNFVLKEDGIPIARIWFFIEGEKAISGQGATFGSIDYSVELKENAINYFLGEVWIMLRKLKINKIIIKHWPEVYPGFMKEELFLKQGFTIDVSEVNQHMLIQEEGYTTHLKYSERKKLNQAQVRGFNFKILRESHLPEVYQLVHDTRVRKGYPVSMSFEDIQKAVESMPDNYLLFGLFDKEKLIAASVSIRVANNILYNFYHADDIAYRSISPLVMLIGKIYEYCRQHGIGILDLGISSENGVVNEGLFNFKRNLGCLSSNKNTYILKND